MVAALTFAFICIGAFYAAKAVMELTSVYWFIVERKRIFPLALGQRRF